METPPIILYIAHVPCLHGQVVDPGESRQSRASGLLLHVTSLPGPYGVGDVGLEARSLVERLRSAGQRYWQVLPVGPTGYGNSPYQSSSAFAGNPLLISPDLLVEQALVEKRECEAIKMPDGRVDYDNVRVKKHGLLREAATRFSTLAAPNLQERYAHFCARHGEEWLDDYCLYVALKDAHGGRPWTRWDDDLVRRDPRGLTRAQSALEDEVETNKIVQFLFFEQWRSLREVSREQGVELVGDLPLYVAHDSADVWANPQLFHLDDRGEPTLVAGVPPDYFSETGQRWGNPIFDWGEMTSRGFRWWRARVRHALTLFDRLRIDHFRGIAGYWAIPAEESTAVNGEWRPGPGAKLLNAIKDEIGQLPFIAEDLGVITEDVVALRETFDLPGMRVAQFGFDRIDDSSLHHPDNYPEDVWAYTGTHDNNTTEGWFWEGNPRRRVWRLKRPRRSLYRRVDRRIPWGLVEMVASSRAMTSTFPLQDILGLDADSRMNTPGTTEGNWEWRLHSGELTDEALDKLRWVTGETGRS